MAKRRTLAVLLAPLVAASQSLAAPGCTTADVNFRAGPGTDSQSFGVVPNGTPLGILDCTTSSGWCSVSLEGVGGYVSSHCVKETPLSPQLVAGRSEASDPAAATLDSGELDAIVAPITLYPDKLLAQLLVAATVPLDIVKAQR